MKRVSATTHINRKAKDGDSGRGEVNRISRFRVTQANETNPIALKPSAYDQFMAEWLEMDAAYVQWNANTKYLWKCECIEYSKGVQYEFNVTPVGVFGEATFVVRLSKAVVSVAVSEWYDSGETDDIDFEVDAELLYGQEPQVINTWSVAYSGNGFASITSATDVSTLKNKKKMRFAVHIEGWVGSTQTNGAVDDTFVTFTLNGNAMGSLAIVENRKGEDGVDGVAGITYEIVPNATTIHKSSDGTLIPEKISAKFYRTNAEDEREAYRGFIFYIFYKDDGTISSSTISTIPRTEMPNTVIPNDAVVMLICVFKTYTDAQTRYYRLTNNESLDGSEDPVMSISIPIVNDGKNGYSAYLSSNVGMVRVGTNGKTTTAVQLTTTPYVVIAEKDTKPNDVTITQETSGTGITTLYNGESNIVTINVPKDLTIPDGGYFLNIAISCGLGTTRLKYNIVGVRDGANGVNGVTVNRTEWEEGKMYRNDKNDESVDPITGNRVMDYVSVSDGDTALWYLCKTAHESTEDNKPNTSGGAAYWTLVEESQPMRTSFADIATAIVNYLQVNQIAIMDDNRTYGAFGGGTDYPLWFGGSTVNDAVFKVSKDGAYYAERQYTKFGMYTFDLNNNEEDWKVINPQDIKSLYYLAPLPIGERNSATEIKCFFVLPYAGDVEGLVVEIFAPNDDTLINSGTGIAILAKNSMGGIIHTNAADMPTNGYFLNLFAPLSPRTFITMCHWDKQEDNTMCRVRLIATEYNGIAVWAIIDIQNAEDWNGVVGTGNYPMPEI